VLFGNNAFFGYKRSIHLHPDSGEWDNQYSQVVEPKPNNVPVNERGQDDAQRDRKHGHI
jgi:hypothetical protein